MSKKWLKSFINEVFNKSVGFICIRTVFSRQKTQFFHKLFNVATKSGRSMGGCNFGNISLIIVPKCHGGKNHFCRWKTCQSCFNFTIWNRVCTITLRILLKPIKLSFKRDTTTAKAVSQLRCLEERKNMKLALQMKKLVLLSLART